MLVSIIDWLGSLTFPPLRGQTSHASQCGESTPRSPGDSHIGMLLFRLLDI